MLMSEPKRSKSADMYATTVKYKYNLTDTVWHPWYISNLNIAWSGKEVLHGHKNNNKNTNYNNICNIYFRLY